MALDPSGWGTKVAQAVKAIGITGNQKITDGQLAQVWQAICGEHDTEISTNLEATGTTEVTGGSSAGSYSTTIPAGGAD